MFSHVPTIGEIGVKENVLANQKRRLKGGETVALEQLVFFLKTEEDQLIKEGPYRPLDIKRNSLVSSQQSQRILISDQWHHSNLKKKLECMQCRW